MHRALLLLLFAAPLSAQPAPTPAVRLHGETDAAQTRKRLAEGQAKLTAGKTAEAVDDLLRVLAESGDDLVQLPDGSHQPARRLIHRILSGLPADALRALRDRIDEPAKKLLEAGKANRDPKPLLQLLDRYFVSRPAEQALLMLGELAFERGDFAAAERYWKTLLPPVSLTDTAPFYPQPTADPATVTAKVLLAALFAGDVERVRAELPKYREKHPEAAGRLAGTDGKFADTLAQQLLKPPVLPADAGGWSTFGGNPHRDVRASTPLPRYYPNRPTWKTAFPRDPADTDRPRPAGFPAAKTLAFHPVFLNGTAYVADAGRVFAFDPRTGAARVAYDLRALGGAPGFDAKELAKPTLFDADFTLTAANGKLYARLGTPNHPTGAEKAEEKKPVSFLLELQPLKGPNPPGNAPTLKPTWTVNPPVKAGVPAAWEGPPLVVDGIAVAAFTRIENSRRMYGVAAYRPPAVKPIWTAEVCDADANQTDGADHRHELLTLAGGNAVYATHAGITAALDVATGKLAWAFRNPPAARPHPGGSPRDLSPAVYSAGKVFVAPADGDRLYALDADTGAKAWESTAAVQIEQLLGVSRNRVIATVFAPQKGLRAYSATDGNDREPAGWRNHDDPQLGSYGRGLVSDDLILWPTREKLYPMASEDGSVARPPLPGPHGNLAFADGVLLVATPTEVWGYVFDPSTGKTDPALPRPVVRLEPTPFRAAELAPQPRAEFEPLAAPVVPADALPKTFTLPAKAWPLEPIGEQTERLFVTNGSSLFAVRPNDGGTVWEAKLAPPAHFTRVLPTTDSRLLAVGSDAVGCFDAKTGAAKWRYELSGYEFNSVALAGNRVVVRLNELGLLALDLDTGKPAWLADAQLRDRLPDRGIDSAPRFTPHLLGTPRGLFAQRTDGTRIVLDPATGKPLNEVRTASAGWVAPPVTLPGGASVVLSGGTLVAAAPVGGTRADWSRDFGGEASATGIAPTVRLLNGMLLVAVHRNYGVELHRLDATRGRPVWLTPVVAAADGVDWSAADADRDTLFVPVGNRLLALAADTGREVWSVELPGANWRLRVGRFGVIAVPPDATRDEPFGEVAERVAWRFAENPGRFIGLLGTLVETWWRRSFPVLLLDSDTGKLLKRWDVPVGGPVVGVHFAADGVTVAHVGGAVRLAK